VELTTQIGSSVQDETRQYLNVVEKGLPNAECFATRLRFTILSVVLKRWFASLCSLEYPRWFMVVQSEHEAGEVELKQNGWPALEILFGFYLHYSHLYICA
jgi:hypothetical protein